MNKSEALRLALEALEMSRRFVYADNRPQCDEAIDALRAALAQQDAPVREPVQEPEGLDWRYTARIGYVVKPYTAPPQRKPLTQEEIDRICASLGFAAISPAEIVRAVERAHGIGETK
jgi:hypothetical protein